MTIKDIAKQCGVSVSTVSRVLNNRPDVSEAVRRRVLTVVEAESYIPNNSARDLVSRQSDAIGVVVRGMGNLFFSDMLKTVSSEIDRSGYNMVLRFIDSDADEIKAGAILEREKKLRALLFLGGRYDYTPAELSLIGVPYAAAPTPIASELSARRTFPPSRWMTIRRPIRRSNRSSSSGTAASPSCCRAAMTAPSASCAIMGIAQRCAITALHLTVRSSPRPAAALKCRRATPACAALSTAARTSPLCSRCRIRWRSPQ